MLQNLLCQPVNRADPVNSVVCRPGGSECLDGNKSFEKWYETGFFGPNNTFPTVVPANQMIPLTLTARSSDNNAGNLNLSQLIAIFTDRRLAVRLHSQWLDRYFSNVAIPIEFLTGTPNFPAWFGGSVYVKAGTGITAEVTDLSGADNTVTMLSRGFRNLIQQGQEQKAQMQEDAYWNKFRKFLPFLLGPDGGPQMPAVGATALIPGASVQIVYTCPSEGDFFIYNNYLGVYGDGGVTSDMLVTSWTEGNTNTFVDTSCLPIRADLVFSSSYALVGWPDNFVRGGGQPGGWGGDPWSDDGQWCHRLHRGTQMVLTIKNNGAFTVRVCPIFAGFLGTCDPGPNEFLAFPMNQGQLSRQFQGVPPGQPTCGPCGPGGQQIPVSQQTKVIVAPQYAQGPGGMPQAAPGVQGGRYMAPGRQQLYRGGQGW